MTDPNCFFQKYEELTAILTESDGILDGLISVLTDIGAEEELAEVQEASEAIKGRETGLETQIKIMRAISNYWHEKHLEMYVRLKGKKGAEKYFIAEVGKTCSNLQNAFLTINTSSMLECFSDESEDEALRNKYNRSYNQLYKQALRLQKLEDRKPT